MAVESATYISQLNPALPADGDEIPEGDNHLRLTKQVLQNQFPSLGAAPVTATAAQINDVVNKAPLASPALTGTPTAPTAGTSTNTTQLATTAFVQSEISRVNTRADAFNVTVSNSAAVALAAGQLDATTFAGACTWTLPASPSVGQRVGVKVGNSRVDNSLGRNGQLIEGLAENMTVNGSYACVTLTFFGGSIGWGII